MTHMRRRLRALLATLVAVGTLASGIVLIAAQPAAAYSITQTSSDPGKTLRHDWGPAIVIEKGPANSCLTRGSSVSGRQNLCRVVDGYESIGDRRNWLIDFAINERPLGASGSNSSQYGYTITLDNGAVYSGCSWLSPSNDYQCDYRERKQIVLKTSGSAYSYVLRKLWNWTQYAGNAASCAGGIASLWNGGSVTALFLTACMDGPM